MINVTFIGLGIMGYPMAGHLKGAGLNVTVWNRNAKKANGWARQYDGLAENTIEDAVKDAQFVMLCVGNDQDVYDVAGPAIAAMAKGSFLIDHTTASASCARKCAQMCADKGIGYLDAPISGGEAGAVIGALTIMCGGAQDDYKAAVPVMAPYTKAVKLMGPVGAGQLTKMVNQICIAGTLQGLSEAINFAQKAGLDVDNVVDAIGKGAAQSWQMDNRASTMGRGEFEFGFAVDWMRKDLGIAIAEAEQNGADLTLAKLVDGYYKQVQDMGGSRWDTSSLIKRLTS